MHSRTRMTSWLSSMRQRRSHYSAMIRGTENEDQEMGCVKVKCDKENEKRLQGRNEKRGGGEGYTPMSLQKKKPQDYLYNVPCQ